MQWSGFYFGTSFGYGWGKSSSQNRPTLGAGNGFNNGAVASTVSMSTTGLASGIHVGYNFQSNQFVYGLELEAGALGPNKSRAFFPALPRDRAMAQFGFYGAAYGRLGFAIDRTLIYAKGGIVYGKVKNVAGDLTLAGGFNVTDLTRSSGMRTGWSLGAGIEYAISPGMTLRGEYQYIDFGSQSSRNADGDVFRHKNNVHVVRVGLSYLFPSSIAPIAAKY